MGPRVRGTPGAASYLTPSFLLDQTHGARSRFCGGWGLPRGGQAPRFICVEVLHVGLEMSNPKLSWLRGSL